MAARFAARETLNVAPSQAVRGSAVEDRTVGRLRRGAALVVAALGLAAAFSPLVVPGTVGSASAASSALLLVGAAALAGPLLITWAFDRTTRFDGHLGPAGRLAVGNVRGFSRRLATVVVPLALALTVGTTQTTVDRTVAEAGTVQLRDGLRADLVVSSPGGPSRSAVDPVAALPGVTGTTAFTSASAQVRTDADLQGFLEPLAWEPTAVLSLTPGPTGLLLDPDVRAGSLADLTGSETIAVSSDATFDTGFEIGAQVPLRWADGSTSSPTVVAVYERGLGFGGYLVGPNGLDAHRANPASLLVATSPGSLADVQARVADLGLVVQSPAAYAQSATDAGAAARKLSVVLLLALLAFVFLAAANTLVMVTARRRPEFQLYGRTGATRGQLLRMAFLEAGLTGGLAWVVGTVLLVPLLTVVPTAFALVRAPGRA